MNELREEIELPALDVTEEEAALALQAMRLIYDGPYMEPGQMITLLQAKLDASYRVLHCRERQLKSSLEANREQKEEIERLKQHLTAVQHIAVKLQEQRDELASVGEKWIEIKPNTVLTDQMEVGRWIRKDKWVITRLEGEPAEGWQYIAPNDFFTHYRMLAPPTLPGEEK